MRSRSKNLRLIAGAYLWSISFWISLAVLMTWQEYVIERTAGLQIHFFQLLLAYSIREDFTLALLTPPIFYVVGRFAIGFDKPLRGALAYLCGFVPFVICYGCIRWILAEVSKVPISKIVPRADVLGLVTVTLGDLTIAYIAIVIAAHAYEYFERVRAREFEQHELQQALAASELQALKSQLHPHFLFNTLHGISTLIDTDRALAKAMVVELANLLRMSLQHGSSDLVTLEEEIKFLDSYLGLEKMRLGTRLEIRRSIGPGTLSVLVPQLILQPLVENAILHGIACCREGGWLEIAARRADGSLQLEIRNSVGGKRHNGTGLGLKNTRARLTYLYSNEATFSFAVFDDHIATATLVLPAVGLRQQTSAQLSATGTRV